MLLRKYVAIKLSQEKLLESRSIIPKPKVYYSEQFIVKLLFILSHDEIFSSSLNLDFYILIIIIWSLAWDSSLFYLIAFKDSNKTGWSQNK